MRTARPSSARKISWGSLSERLARCNWSPARQTSSALTTRLRSSVACRRSSRCHADSGDWPGDSPLTAWSPSSPGAGSCRRRHNLQDPPRAAASARHSPMRCSSLASSPTSAITWGDGEERAVSHDSAAVGVWSVPGRGTRIRGRLEPASDSRHTASTNASRAWWTIPSAGTPSAVSARQTGGSERVTVRTRSSSAPFIRGSHRASYPHGADLRFGSTLPAATISRAKAARAENGDTEAPGCSSGDATNLKARATSSAAEGLTLRAVTSKGQSLGACLLIRVTPSPRMSSGEGWGAWAFPGSQTTRVRSTAPATAA